METIQLWREIALNSITEFGGKLLGSMPNLLATLVLLIFGYLIARVVSRSVRKLLEKTSIDKINGRLSETEFFSKEIDRYKLSNLISKFIFWIIIFVFLITASETLGMPVVAASLGDLVNYLPKLFAALVIITLGLLLANFIKGVVQTTFTSFNIQGGNGISQLIFYFIVAIVILTGLHQAGINVSLITTNLSLILGSILLAFVIAFISGTKDVLSNIVGAQNSDTSLIKIGDQIKIGSHEGKVVEKNKLYIILEQENKRIFIPNQTLTNQ